MQMSRKLLLFFVFLFLVLSCPSVGVANDKGKVKTIYTELIKRCSVLFFFVLFFFLVKNYKNKNKIQVVKRLKSWRGPPELKPASHT